MKKSLYIITVFIILAIGGALYYWYFFMQNPVVTVDSEGNPISDGFSPFNRPGNIVTPSPTDIANNDQASSTEEVIDNSYKLPKLRQLSTFPVAGVSASSTASSSIARFVDRGTGHVYEANTLYPEIKKISNTTLPKVYEAYANKNGTSFIVRYLKGDTDIVSSFYTELRSTGTSTTETPFELKGKFISPDINQVSVSPNGDKVFTWNIESGNGVGYISSFDEKTRVKILNLPLTQVNVDWPEINTLVLSTKASAISSGFMYTIDAKTGVMKSVLSNIRGLTGKVSHDLSRVLYTSGSMNNMVTSVWNIKDNRSEEVIFKTISDKCVWSTLRKNEVYCAVPTEIPDAMYPDDWYKGSVSFIDQIWHLDTTTGEVHLLANLLTLSSKLIDATKLTLDPSEDTLYFTNKRDLTLWALDLNQ
jgi:hypothetical protein